MKRPIVYWVILFILGAVLYKLSIYVVGAIGVFFLIYSVNNRRLGRRWLLQFMGVIFFALGVFCMHSWRRMERVCNLVEGTTVTMKGKVTKCEEKANSISYIVKATELNGKETAMNVQISIKDSYPLLLGSSIIGVGVVEEFSVATNPGAYNEKMYKQGNGILLALKQVEIRNMEKPVVAWREYLYRFRKQLSDVYATLFDEKNASLVSAMVLGDKSNLDKDVKALYQRNGIAHLIAISGLHIAMIGGTLYKLLRRMTGSYPIAAIIGASFIILYGVMTGLSGATLRAVIMLVVLIGADVAGRRYDGLSAMALALLIMLVNNPYQITQVGFLLSFGAVLGITIIQPIWKIWFPGLPRCLDGMFISVSVQLCVCPILLYYFYEIPIYSVFLNILVVPLMNVLLAMLIVCGMIGLFSRHLAAIPATLANIIFSLYEKLCEVSELLPGHTMCTGQPSLWWVVAYYILLFFVVWISYYGKKIIAGLSLLFLFLMLGAFLLPSDVVICVLDVGQGDGIYIRTRNQKHILLDSGSSSKKQIGQYVLKNSLKYYGADKLDYVFVSHIDGDHYSGIEELLQEEIIEIENMVLPAIRNPDEAYVKLQQLAMERGCKIFYMQKGDSLQMDGMEFICLNPLQQSYEDKNAGSIVLQMRYGEFDLLLTGDLTEEGEGQLLQDIVGSIEVLKVAHHGSATSSSKAFLQRVSPGVACISVGEKNNQLGKLIQSNDRSGFEKALKQGSLRSGGSARAYLVAINAIQGILAYGKNEPPLTIEKAYRYMVFNR